MEMQHVGLQSSFQGTPRFQILRRLGQGGMGVVFEALDREHNVRVALKTIHTLTADSLLKFKNEFRALQDLRHPNLVRLGELQEAGGTWFFTMELVEGVDLTSHVWTGSAASALALGSQVSTAHVPHPPEEQGATMETVPVVVPASGDTTSPAVASGRYQRHGFDERRLREALHQLATGVSAVHAARMVHRDIKPSNVLVTKSGRVVILDFGLVIEASSARALAGGAVGTAAFMAPEQGTGGAVGPAADWYSVGATLYLVLTGRPPYLGSLPLILAQRDAVEIVPPAQLVADLPAGLSELCMGLLRTDPELRLDERAIFEWLGAAPAAASHYARPSGNLFVGRTPELEVLRAGFARARAGHPVALLVSGESGVGKSSLVRQLLDELGRDPRTVLLTGRCYERESVPYKAVDQVIDALGQYLGQLPDEEVESLLPARFALVASVFTVLNDVKPVAHAVGHAGDARAVDPFQHRSLVFAALRELFERLSRRAPLVVFIDDLQWADADSLSLLATIMQTPGAPALFFVTTVRAIAGGESQTLATLRRHLGDDVGELLVPRLPPEAARELAERLVAQTDSGAGVRAETIAAEAGGHPLFIDALIRHRLSHPDDAGPVRLDDALVARVDALGESSRRVLELICLAGGPLPQEACAHAAAISFGELAELASTLRAADLVKTNGVRRGDLIEPYHDRVREAIASRLGDDARTGAHDRLARALESSPNADPEVLAVHFRKAGDARKAARFAARAADRAATALAFDRAARLYRDALTDPATPEVEQSLRLRLAEALSNAGRGGDAAEAYLAAAQHDSERTLELHRLAAEQFLRSGRTDDAAHTLEAVLAKVGRKLPRTRGGAILAFMVGRAKLKLRGLKFERRDASQVPADILQHIEICHSMMPLGMTDPLRGQPFAAWHLRLALDSGVPAKIVRAIGPEIAVVATAGQPSAARVDAYAKLGLELSAEAKDPYAHGLLLGALGIASYCLSRWRKCREYCEACYRVVTDECTGASFEQNAAVLYGMRGLFFNGELAELARQLPVAMKSALERGDVYMQANLSLAMSSSHVWLAQDHGEAVRDHTARAIRAWNYPGVNLQHVQELWSLLSLELYEGDVEAAGRRLAETWPKIAGSMYMRMQVLRMTCHDFRARHALAAAVRCSGSERKAHLAQARQDAQRLGKEKLGWGDALVARIEAAMAHIEGDAAAAIVRLEQAERRFEVADMALHATIMRRQRGVLLGGDEGRVLVSEAEAGMRAQAILRPERFAALLAPGFATA